MRHSRLLISITLSLAALGLLIAALNTPSQAAILPGDTIVPMGLAQSDTRTAYRAVLGHLYDGGRVHWADSPISGTVQPGDFVVPGGLDTTTGHTDVTATLPISRAYALRPGGVAVLRSTVVVTGASGPVAFCRACAY